MVKHRNQSGFVLFELSFAFILVSFISGFTIITLLSQREIAQLVPEFAQAIFSTKQNIEISSDTFIGTTTTNGLFTSSSQATFASPCLISILATTSWGTYKPHKITLSTLISSSSLIQNVGNDCGGYSDQSKLTTLTSSSTRNTFTQDISNDLDIVDTFVFNAQQKNSLGIFSIFSISTTSQGLTLVSTTSSDIFNSIDAIIDFTFAAAQSTTSQFQVIETRNPQQPKIIKKISLPGVSSTGSFPAGLSIFYYNKKIYIGTHRTAGNEFHIFDVIDPVNPKWLGSIELNHNINDITVFNSVAYLATSGNTSDIIILDVSNPQNIKRINDINIPEDDDSTTIYNLGTNIFIGKNKAKIVNHPEVYILDCASSTDPAPRIIATITIGQNITDIRAINKSLIIGTKNNLFISDWISTSSPRKVSEVSGSRFDIQNNIIVSSGNSLLNLFSL